MDVGRAQRFGENEVRVLVHEVKARQARIYGTASRPTRRDDAKQAWVEVAMAVSAFSGIHRTVDQVKKKFDSTKRSGRRKAEANRKEQWSLGGSLTPGEDLAASSMFPESSYYDIVEVQVGAASGEQCVDSRLQLNMDSPDDSSRDLSVKMEDPLDVSIKQEDPEDHLPGPPNHGLLHLPGRVPEATRHHLQEHILRKVEKQGFLPLITPSSTEGPLMDHQLPVDPPEAQEQDLDLDRVGPGVERGPEDHLGGGLPAEPHGRHRPKRPRLLEEEDPDEGTSVRQQQRLRLGTASDGVPRRDEEDYRHRPTGGTRTSLLERELGGLRRGLRSVNLAMRRGLAAMAQQQRLLGRGVAALERSAAALERLAGLQVALVPPPPHGPNAPPASDASPPEGSTDPNPEP